MVTVAIATREPQVVIVTRHIISFVTLAPQDCQARTQIRSDNLENLAGVLSTKQLLVRGGPERNLGQVT